MHSGEHTGFFEGLADVDVLQGHTVMPRVENRDADAVGVLHHNDVACMTKGYGVARLVSRRGLAPRAGEQEKCRHKGRHVKDACRQRPLTGH